MSDVVRKETLGARLRATVSIFLPKPLQELHKRGLLLVALAIIGVVVAVPLLVAFLAAFWLSWAATSNVTVIQLLRRSYVEQIRGGFGVDEKLASDLLELNKRLDYLQAELNKRLDYLQALEFDLGPESDAQKPIKNVNLQVQRGQRLVLTLTYVSLTPDDKCKLDPSVKLGDLLDVKIGNGAFVSCRETITQRRGGGCTQALDEHNWTTFKEYFFGNAIDPKDPDVRSVMTFQRSEGLRQSCSPLHVEGDIAIFKDVYNMASQ